MSGLGSFLLVAADSGVQLRDRRCALEECGGALIEPPEHRRQVGGSTAGAEQRSPQLAVAGEEGFTTTGDLVVADGEQPAVDRFIDVMPEPGEHRLVQDLALRIPECVRLPLDAGDLEQLSALVPQHGAEAEITQLVEESVLAAHGNPIQELSDGCHRRRLAGLVRADDEMGARPRQIQAAVRETTESLEIQLLDPHARSSASSATTISRLASRQEARWSTVPICLVSTGASSPLRASALIFLRISANSGS